MVASGVGVNAADRCGLAAAVASRKDKNIPAIFQEMFINPRRIMITVARVTAETRLKRRPEKFYGADQVPTACHPA